MARSREPGALKVSARRKNGNPPAVLMPKSLTGTYTYVPRLCTSELADYSNITGGRASSRDG